MSELRIPFDPLNPGQFFACCGLIELFDLRGALVLSHFAIDPARPRHGEFVMASGQALDIEDGLRTLRGGQCSTPEFPEELKTLAPVRLDFAYGTIEFDWWLDEFRTDKTPLKCWAGQQTSLSITEELIGLLPEQADPGVLRESAMTTSRFGVDPRSAWKALDFGSSPNEQKRESATFAATEVLAAIGLQGFRPGGSRRSGMRYSAWRQALPRAVARLACSDPWEGLAKQTYEFQVAERGSYRFFEFAKGVNAND